MEPHIWYVSSCKTCTKILDQIKNIQEFKLQDLKKNNITEEQLAFLYKISGSYEALFNKRARKFQKSSLKEKTLSQEDYKQGMLSEYTFLKRPVIYYKSHLHIGSVPSQIEKTLQIINN